MPFVNIRLVEGQSQERKDEIAARIATAVSEVTGLAPADVWVTFQDIPAAEWYIGTRSVRSIRAGRG